MYTKRVLGHQGRPPPYTDGPAFRSYQATTTWTPAARDLPKWNARPLCSPVLIAVYEPVPSHSCSCAIARNLSRPSLHASRSQCRRRRHYVATTRQIKEAQAPKPSCSAGRHCLRQVDKSKKSRAWLTNSTSCSAQAKWAREAMRMQHKWRARQKAKSFFYSFGSKITWSNAKIYKSRRGPELEMFVL